MDWNAAIERNREALKRVLSGLLAMAGLSTRASTPGDCPPPAAETLPRHVHRAVRRLLCAAEAAVRRLVIVAARGLREVPLPARLRRRRRRRRLRLPIARGFALFDPLRNPVPRRRFGSAAMPRISVPGVTVPAPLPRRPTAFDAIDTAPFARRIAVLGAVLDDLPRHARRFARWRATRDARRAAEGAQNGENLAAPAQARTRGSSAPQRRFASRYPRTWPLRPGHPPGHPSRRARRSPHEVHDILEITHGLAIWALQPHDTS